MEKYSEFLAKSMTRYISYKNAQYCYNPFKVMRRRGNFSNTFPATLNPYGLVRLGLTLLEIV
jgi:hypothetical protein